ncbi:ATP-dependent helicase [Anaerocolumna sp. AGMB13025]|uniref:ATP-dependent helicase n=1 Tax=Anaerocolumna sp. AGMB13025 TaxID=3039116 RepID=UPI00241F37FA|nr:ATP-dependent helicase [Anaerocolumna sp. AGMB13025]WFR57149.1 ATP-dependent helicase [Anaerocolumna sp. AGMB13025]
MTEYFIKKLNEIQQDSQQLRAYNSRGSAVVVAGPGSGKTTVLTLKVMRLLEEIILPPRGLACLTYSTEAAREFKDRLSKLGLKKRENVFLGTVHSFCLAEILTPFAHLYPQYRIPNPIRIISERDKKEIFDSIPNEGQCSMTEMDKERTRDIQGISRVSIESYDIALKAAVEFEDALLKDGWIDFISMVKFSVKLIQNEPYVRKSLGARFPWVIVDEYQDLGKPLHEIVLALLNLTNIRVFAVGDGDQSIYDFQGAAPDYLTELSFRKDVELIQLKNNYRSSQDIVNASEHILESQRGYIASGQLSDYSAIVEFYECEGGMDEQYRVATEQIKRFHDVDVPYHEIAILVGSNNQVKELCAVCDEQGIPVYFARQEFRNTDAIYWLQNCARWVEDKSKVSFNEICLSWKGFLSLKKSNAVNEEEFLSVKKMILNVLRKSKSFEDDLSKWLSYIFTELQFLEVFSELDRYPDEIENLYKLLEIANDNQQMLTIEFISRLGIPKNQVMLTTRHSAKGLEFDTVIMLGMEKDSFPSYYCTSQRQFEEARRLCFVAVSRARKACLFVRSKNLPNKYGKWFAKEPSPFWTTLYNYANK